MAQWLERRTRDRKVEGSSSDNNGGSFFFFFFFFRANFLCWLLFRYPFRPCITAVASKSFCHICRWQVTVKHWYTLRKWLWMKLYDIIHGYMVYRERTETAVVLRGETTNHVTTKQCCKYTAWVIVQTCGKKLLSLKQIHRQERSRAENSAI